MRSSIFWSSNSPKASHVILMVEDSNEDYTAFMRMIQEFSVTHPIYRACDGEDALDYLYRQGNYADPAISPRPALILMDLNLPGTDGREVIQQIKQDADLQSIPIVALTTSSNPKDIEACYRYGVNSYLLKPIGVEALRNTIRVFFQYWFESVVLPTNE